MIHILIQHLIYIIVVTIISLLLTKYTILNNIFVLAMPLHFITQTRTSYNSLRLFGKIKSVSVLIPLFFYSYHRLFPNINIATIISYILALNVSEPGLLIGINSNEILSKINGLCIVILALYTPKLTLKNNIIGYDNNQLWGICKTILLTTVYLFNDYFYKDNWRYPAIYALLIPTFVSLFTNNSRYWVPLRVYSMIITWFITNKYPNIHDNMVNYLNSKYLLSTDKYNKHKAIFVIIGIIVTIKLILQGKINTILDI